ncbi:hypothetical protein DFJ73DRAFT_93740 [Zopfochytrium polystomum]|nr:hypothetical protein DFJ73DRAFT_93740 [Zopfochytrium polystomum]
MRTSISSLILHDLLFCSVPFLSCYIVDCPVEFIETDINTLPREVAQRQIATQQADGQRRKAKIRSFERKVQPHRLQPTDFVGHVSVGFKRHLADTTPNMQAGKAVARTVKNFAKGYSDIQIKVRTATSNDPSPPSSQDMAAIARATYDPQSFIEIMEMIDKRLNDSGKNWRHVYKSLVLLDCLIHTGSDQVVKYAKENLYVVKTLKEFQVFDDDGRDQGVNIRQLSKDITALLSDEARLREERAGRGYSSNSNGNSSRGAPSRAPNDYYNEDAELQKALAESRKTAAEDAKRNPRRAEEEIDDDLRRAIELSEKEAAAQAAKAAAAKAPEPPKDDLIDFFASTDTPQPNLIQNAFALDATPFGQPYQDPFALQMQQQQLQQAQLQQAILAQQQQEAAQQQLAQLQQQQLAAQQAQQAQELAAQQAQLQQQLALQQQQQQQQLALQQQQQLALQQQQQQAFSTPFGNAFDGGAAAKKLPHQLTDNAASRLADIARNSEQIDPFASLASARSSPAASGFGTPSLTAGSGVSNPFAAVSQTQQKSTADIFGSSIPSPTISASAPFGGANPLAGISGSSFANASAQAKNPFQTQQKFQWESASNSTASAQPPTLAQLSSANGTNSNATNAFAGLGSFGQSTTSIGGLGAAGGSPFAQPSTPANGLSGLNGLTGFGNAGFGQPTTAAQPFGSTQAFGNPLASGPGLQPQPAAFGVFRDTAAGATIRADFEPLRRSIPVLTERIDLFDSGRLECQCKLSFG